MDLTAGRGMQLGAAGPRWAGSREQGELQGEYQECGAGADTATLSENSSPPPVPPSQAPSAMAGCIITNAKSRR